MSIQQKKTDFDAALRKEEEWQKQREHIENKYWEDYMKKLKKHNSEKTQKGVKTVKTAKTAKKSNDA